MDKVSNIPPQHPKGGQIFLISDGNNKARQNNWSCDGYPWVNKGGYGVPKKNPIVFARKYTLRQHSGDLKGCEDFIRRAYFIKDSPFKLVHYVGDESKYIPRPHGNQKDQQHGDYRRTLPSVLRHIESNSTAQPMTMYREMTTKTKTTGPYQGVANKKAGKKQPRPCDEDQLSVINPAPDSAKKQYFFSSTPISTPQSILKKCKASPSIKPSAAKKIRFEHLPSLSDSEQHSVQTENYSKRFQFHSTAFFTDTRNI
jgi:hypothetical protein